jgi:hypothetical protein
VTSYIRNVVKTVQRDATVGGNVYDRQIETTNHSNDRRKVCEIDKRYRLSQCIVAGQIWLDAISALKKPLTAGQSHAGKVVTIYAHRQLAPMMLASVGHICSAHSS